jgi:hypothetical protein
LQPLSGNILIHLAVHVNKIYERESSITTTGYGSSLVATPKKKVSKRKKYKI